jgi:outer membrane protein OmpA-like peptidoglycan-associated protein
MNDETTLASEGPFLLQTSSAPMPRAYVPAPEGPFELPVVPETPRKTAAVAPTRGRYASWSDADDRAKGRNPRDQLIGGRPSTQKNVLVYPPIAGRNERLFVLKNFKIDGAALRSDHRAFLADVAKWMGSGERWRIFIEAHASRTGAARHDDVLSEDRYLATRALLETELLRRGVDMSRVRIAGQGVGFRHTRLPGEDPRARSIYAVVQPDPSPRPPQPFPPPSLAINWLLVVPPGLLSIATVENLAPIRADEGGKFLNSFRNGNFLIFVPLPVSISSRKELTNVKVHVFFAAGGVLGSTENDVVLHGLRGASAQSEWITIGVHGIDGGANPIGDAQISGCLRSIGITAPPVAVRLTGHSRGCDSLVATVSGKLIKTPLDRLVFLDEAVEHVSLQKKNPDGTPDPKRGSVRLNRVAMMVQAGISPQIIFSYEAAHKSVNLLTGKSARVPGATYFDLKTDCVAALGEARLVEDAMALDPNLAMKAKAVPAIVAQLNSLHPKQAALPRRGSFTSGPSTPTRKNINDFCSDVDVKKAIKDILNNPVLMRFINDNGLTKYRKSIVPDWTPFAAHEFFVAEIAQELTD